MSNSVQNQDICTVSMDHHHQMMDYYHLQYWENEPSSMDFVHYCSLQPWQQSSHLNYSVESNFFVTAPEPCSIEPRMDEAQLLMTSIPVLESSQEDRFSVIDGTTKSTFEDQVGKTESKKRRRKSSTGPKFALKMKSENEIMEDGYKWRKYGKKRVKSSPHARSYYKCSEDNCEVKKRVERDREDPTMIIVRYEGRHNHESPSNIMCVEPIMLPQEPGSKPTIVFVQTGLFHQSS